MEHLHRMVCSAPEKFWIKILFRVLAPFPLSTNTVLEVFSLMEDSLFNIIERLLQLSLKTLTTIICVVCRVGKQDI